ncbi:M23 family metallopeptidase [Qipengyuania spongiae]|uniref:M23 family metallopeptidase n=1 Tax=Qipengyuania spongiae TaxID=2909673 RepID=A0ABY5T0L0_9SPHN|nr:M23 family metallopeptidase [Qipengyuania spongiae]UVI40034.1 M23 family metallopeptidase [Qipengyuania spongiae]
MTENTNANGGLIARVRGWFPERELFMRSQGQVRFITLSSRLQMTVAGAAVAALLAWGGSLGALGWQQYEASAERAVLLEREASVAKSEHRLQAYRNDVEAATKDLEERQDFLDAAFSSLPAEVKAAAAEDGNTEEGADEPTAKISKAMPGGAALARIEGRQLAFVKRLTRFAEFRADRAERALRKLGLNPADISRNAERAAMGGPLEPILDGDRVDPHFERLGLSLARMNALEQGLEGVPQVLPASLARMSSGFGFRHDPFTGGGAMHAGLDFSGPVGAPIHAAAKGRVTYVGWRSGYGKTVEIRHANGLTTRYAHMSAFKTRVGDRVAPGEVIGAIGSTGRSTGPHLHFEVRIHDRAVNPRIFLEQAPDVLKEIRSAPERPHN